jgi:rod shape-determining protein MreC
MKEFIHSLKFKILLGLFALVVGVLIYAGVSYGSAVFPENILHAIGEPITAVTTSISDWVKSSLDKLVNADSYKQENDVLREQLSEAWENVTDLEELQRENEQLRLMLGIAGEHPEYNWAPPCTVIARTANDVSGGFTVNRGSDDRIAVGDPVFNEVGLIGRVSGIAPTYARVTTILSTDISIGVQTTRNGTVGIIENTVEYAQKGQCLMSYISGDSDVRKGDFVVVAAESVYPEGRAIGVVDEVFYDENGLSMKAVITPAVNVFQVTDAMILITSVSSGGDSAEDESNE